ncbi:MAG: response regulator transcription factor [Neomegalonema sp.]|nr:response regulator transcription factor [Neomegalonema sp.]
MSETSGLVLLVEDDAEIRELVAALLSREGWRVAAAANAAEADAIRAQEMPAAVILDIMLPGEDGLSICRRLRADEGDRFQLPILMLTAKSEDVDRIIGLEMGADDYLPKPFNPRELTARLKALVRRAEASKAAILAAAERSAYDETVARLQVGGLTVDLAARSVIDAGGKPIPLTSGEFDLFAALIDAPGRALSRDHLLDRVYGRTATPFDRAVDMLVSRLRRKIEADPENPSLIKTVRNAGYILTQRPSPLSV